jgi:hypothetical protein
MTRNANYVTHNETDDYIVLEDIGPWDRYPTITNAPEATCEAMLARLSGRKLYYIDTDGNIDQLLIHDNRFAGFVHGGPE